MPEYKAPVEDTEFLLNDVFKIGRHGNLPGFADATPDIIKAILEEAGKFASEALLPLNQSGDAQGCKFKDGEVITPDGFKQAYELLTASGWPGLTADPEYGGQGLPKVLGAAFNEFVSSANMSFGMYPGLSAGAYDAIAKHGTDEQKQTYLPKLASGEWTGTMNLTEPQCGTDLGLVRTKAVPQDDGSYLITGSKIFISAGEHDMAENIVHLVLARIEGAPEGTHGISLFVTPKLLPDDNSRNGVSCGSIEEKMGIHANATCVLNYDNAKGWLVGEKNKGLKAMFTFMNEARLAVGLQGLAQSEIAYQNAVIYARERRQGRSLSGDKEPDKPADPIIVHPDVRRMLMDIKSFNEAARALIMKTALNASIAEHSEDEKERERSGDRVELLTPVIKGVLTDIGFDNTVAAQQVFGGTGYIAETGVEQYVRDARIAMVYEGTNGIQALDLVGRKLPGNGGRAIMGFFKEIGTFLQENEALEDFTKPLAAAAADLEKATGWLMNNAMKDPEQAGAGANDYMHLMGLVALGYMWALMAATSTAMLADGSGNKKFHEIKLITGRYFMERRLPETATRLARIEAGKDTMMELAAEDF